MAKAKRKPRLKKDPVETDYCVQVIYDEGYRVIENIRYFKTRSEARAFVREVAAATRVRIFRIKYELVLDVKRKVRK